MAQIPQYAFVVGTTVKKWYPSTGWRFGVIKKIEISVDKSAVDIRYVIQFFDELGQPFYTTKMREHEIEKDE